LNTTITNKISTYPYTLSFLIFNDKPYYPCCNDSILIKQSKQFEEHFYDAITKQDRNMAILNTYDDGYSQVSISKYLNLSTSLVSKVVKSGYSITEV